MNRPILLSITPTYPIDVVKYLLLPLLLLSACQTPEAATPKPAAATTAPKNSADRVASIQERLQQADSTALSLQPIHSQADQTWIARNEAYVRARLGLPLAELRLHAADSTRTKVVLIYPVAPNDPTGLYLYLRGGHVDSVRHDEFNGFEGNSALHWFHTP